MGAIKAPARAFDNYSIESLLTPQRIDLSRAAVRGGKRLHVLAYFVIFGPMAVLLAFRPLGLFGRAI